MNTIPEHLLYAYIFAALEDDTSFSLLKDRYPDILADLVSAKSNSNCSCRGRVVSYITQKYKTDTERVFLDGIFSKEKTINNASNQIKQNQETITNTLSGKIFTLMKKDNYWEEFTKTTFGKMFRSFSIVDRGDSVDVYFL